MDRENIMAELQQKLIDDRAPSSANSNPGFLINDTADNGRETDIGYGTANIHNILPKSGSSQPTTPIKVATLADLNGRGIDEVLNTEKMQEEMMKPISTRVKVVIEYNEQQRKYVLTDKDEKTLKSYDIPI